MQESSGTTLTLTGILGLAAVVYALYQRGGQGELPPACGAGWEGQPRRWGGGSSRRLPLLPAASHPAHARQAFPPFRLPSYSRQEAR